MSLGLGASCRLIKKEEDYYIFEYSPYSYDMDNWKEAKDSYDGMIYIHQDYFPNPQIITKRKKRPNGRKVWIEKQVYPEIDYEMFLQNGKIKIDNSRYAWNISDEGIDVLALKLIFYLYEEYKKLGKVPEHFGIFS